MTIRHDGLVVDWFGYATTRLEATDGPTVYFDPGRYGVLTGDWTPPGGGDPTDAAHPRSVDRRPQDADVVCVTHDHHYDPDGIERVADENATIVVYRGVDADRIGRDVVSPEQLPFDVVRVEEEDYRRVGDVDVWSVPAYNEPGGPNARDDGSVPHPEGFGVGYRISLDGVSVFWPGDSDALDAFAELETSLFLANIAGSVCMDGQQAAELAARLDPELVLPVHYNTIELLTADSGSFASDVAKRGVPVVLDERA